MTVHLANHRAILGVVLAMALLLGAGQAAEGTPVAIALPPDPATCLVAPRPQDELRALTFLGLEAMNSGREGAPTIGEASSPPSGGNPADAETVAVATEAIRQYLACLNADNLGAMAALLTDESASVLLAASAKGFTGGAALASGTPVQEIDIVTLEVDAATLDAFVAANATSTPRPENEWSWLDEVRDVRRQAGGVVIVTALVAIDPAEPVESKITLREVGGRYLIDLLQSLIERELATPIATPFS